MAEEIERAHVICIVFSVDRQDTLNKVASYWLPFVRENCSDEYRKPVILVGNKIDLIDYSVIDVSLFHYILCGTTQVNNICHIFYIFNILVTEYLGYSRRIS